MSGTTLKWIAVISMLIDHTAEVLINHNAALTDPIWAQIYVLMRGIGRIAFPIYAFLLVEGFLHTRDVKKYLARMLTFAVVSEIPFDLAVFHTPFYWVGRVWWFGKKPVAARSVRCRSMEAGTCLNSVCRHSPAHQLRLWCFWRIFYYLTLYDTVR